jgi:electron transfer flavoprotein beta subunit
MNVIVCIKQVPDTTRVEIDPQTNTLVREGIESVLNPLDSYAIEEALRLRERLGGRVTALTMGPPQAEAALREVLALGADEAVLLTGREFAGSDTWSTSYALACAVRALGGADLILCGRQAIDGDTAQVGPELAVHLGLPQAVCVRRILQVGPGGAVVECLTDAGHDVVRIPLPAVMTAVKELNEPRRPNLEDLHRSRVACIRRLDAAAVGADRDEIGLDGSPTRVVRIFSPPRRAGGRVFEEDLDAGVEAALRLMASEGLL